MSSIDIENFFNDYFNKVHKENPNPTFVSLHRARVHNKITESVLANLHKEGIIRTNGEKPPKFAQEDIKLFLPIRNAIKEMEDAEIFKKTIVEGKKEISCFGHV